MDKKVELQVLNITNSQAQVGAFALLLGEVNGERQLPIIIGPAEAQATALYMKGVKTPRPLTHDLFMTIIGVLGASLLRVLIYKAKDGIFYSYIYLKKDEEIIRIDTRTSDAVGMAIRAECPILIYESILEQECLRISNEERRHPEESDEEAEDEYLRQAETEGSIVRKIPNSVFRPTKPVRPTSPIASDDGDDSWPTCRNCNGNT